MKNTISKGWLSLLIVMGILILDQIIKIAVKTNMYYKVFALPIGSIFILLRTRGWLLVCKLFPKQYRQ